MAAAPDLSAFRTVETAVRAQPSASTGRAGQSGYLGLFVSANSRGRLAVDEVAPESPAEKAGVQPGDLLLNLDRQPVPSAERLREILLSRAPGETVNLALRRKNKALALTATLGSTSRPLKIGSRRALLGVQLDDAEGSGAVIRRIVDGSAAEKAGLKVGDVLLKVGESVLTASNQLSDNLMGKDPGDTVAITYRRDGQEKQVQAQLGADRDEDDSPTREPRGLWKKDLYRLAVVAIEYPDTKHNPKIAAKDWEEALFSKGVYTGRTSVTGQTVYGSMNDYFQEQSVGAFRVDGKVFDWVQVSKDRAEYSQGTGTGSRSPLLGEALDLLLARDGADALKGYDGIFFLYAGGRVRTTRGGLYWPHRSNFNHRGQRWPYFIVQEGGERMSDISVICHEFGHMLGLPDLYARPENPGSEGLGIWCAMSNQAGNGRPQHMSAWCKEQLGWLKPTVIDPTVKQKLVLAPITGSAKECFKVLVRPDGSEYLLLENRRKSSFDESLPAEGLLIWRVVAGRPILEESHGVDGPPGPRVYAASVPYPSSSNNAYTPYTTPSSRSQLGGGLPVHLTNIRRLPDGRVTFYVGYDFQ